MADQEFDSNLNLDYHTKYDNQSNAMADLAGGGIAAVADFGASVWNSLPGTPEVETRDLLSKVSENAMRVYDENQDTVEAASFIGGMFVPTGLALKGMALARAGVKGVSWFSKAGKAADLAKIDTIFAESGNATKAYRAARNEYMLKGLANNALDAVAMEGALVATMNAHPLMEDYMADPVKNFAIGAAFGGTIGGAIGAVADRFAVKQLTGAIESKAFGDIVNELGTAYKSTQTATQLQVQEANIATLTKMIEMPEHNGLTKSIAEKVMLDMKADQRLRFEEMLSPEMKLLDPADKETLLRAMATTQGMSGINEVSFLTQKLDGAGAIAQATPVKGIMSVLQDSPTFKTLTNTQTQEKKFLDAAYFPEFGRFATPNDAKHYARARDLGLTPAQLEHTVARDLGIVPNTNAYEEIFAKNSATLDKDYLATLTRVDKMDIEQIKNMKVSPDDLPLINALVARAAKNPTEFDGVKIALTKNKPNWDVMEAAVHKAAGVSHDYKVKVDSWTNSLAMEKYDLTKGNLSNDTFAALYGWINGGGVGDMRLGADAYFRGGYGVLSNPKAPAMKKVIEELYNNPMSKELRENFRSVADPEGYVYLYRGIKANKAVGHASLESYTTEFVKAQEFGRPQLYKVHVDDILGGIRDIAGRDGVKRNEIIVASPARPTVADLPVGAVNSTSFVKKANTSIEEVDSKELYGRLGSLKGELINSMMAQGLPLETIAIRTNTPLDSVKLFATSAEDTGLQQLDNFMHYNDASKVKEYLAPADRALRVKSEIKKANFSTMKADMDGKMLNDIHHELTSVILQKSDSTIAKSIGDYLYTSRRPMIDMLRAEISQFVNSKAGSKFFNSTDFYTRDMGNAGIIANTLGKDMQHFKNEALSTVLGPVRERMAAITPHETQLIEANTALNVNSQLSGYRIYKDRQFWQKTGQKDLQGNPILKAVEFEGKEYKVVSDSVDSMLTEMQGQGRELYKLKNTTHSILGKRDMNDIGFWVPSINPKGKFISYVHDHSTDSTRMLWANTKEELIAQEQAFAKTLTPGQTDVKIITKSDQESWNILNGRNDGMTMDWANVEAQKGGSAASAIVKNNVDIFAELAGGYEHYVNAQVTQLADIALHDVTDTLSRMSSVNQQYFKNQPLTPLGKHINQPKDAASVIRNTILGNSNLSEYTGWQAANQSFETGLSMAVRGVTKVWDTATAPLKKGFFGGKKDLTPENMQKLDYKRISDELEKQGIVNPWKVFDDEAASMYGLAKLEDHKDVSKRLVYASNAFAATLALRVGELAQPLVNAMSLPILTSLAIANRMPESFMGVQKGTAKVSGVQVMYEGARAQHDPAYKGLERLWEGLGYFKPLVSEANETLAMARSFNPGVIGKVEKALDSKMVSIMSKPADWSEALVRKQTMFTGAVLAKRLYPELDDMGVTIFARDFMDRAVGNYHASQRPVLFQGTAGVALGLFQTYMLTMGQSIYRGIELKNYKALGTAALLQGGLFGAKSMPGFDLISKTIGEHFSDNNYDLQTGTYRALPDKMADAVLYGLPSSMGPALYTRGEIAPRAPNVLTKGATDIVGVNMVMQTVDSMKHIAGAMGKDYPDIGRGILEAISMQSMSRPLSRGAELVNGYSVTKKGNTVSTPDEVWTATGIMSRVISTRPLMEAKYREALHLNTYYGSLDRDARGKLTGELKLALRNGTVNDGLLGRLGEEYMRKGGTPTGWRSAVRTSLAQTNVSGSTTLANKLDDDSPLMHMIDSLDGE